MNVLHWQFTPTSTLISIVIISMFHVRSSFDTPCLGPTSRTRLRARDHSTSSTLISGKGGAGGPSSLHTTLEGPTNGVYMWMQDGCKVYMHSYMTSNGSCFMVTWTVFTKSSLGGRPNTTPGDHGTLDVHNCWFILFYHV